MSDTPMNFSDQQITQIAATCAEHMQRYNLGQSSNPQACHELLRRAFDEQQHEAFDHVFILFAPRLRRWLRRHLKNHRDLIDDIVHETFEELLRDSQQGAFVVARYTLPQVLYYIKRRTLFVSKSLSRKGNYPIEKPDQLADESVDHLSDLDDVIKRVQPLLTSEEWQMIADQYLNNEVADSLTARRLKLAALAILLRQYLTVEEFELFHLRHVDQMKPAAIARRYNMDVKAVSLRLASLMRRIRNKSDLLKLFGIPNMEARS